MELEKQISFIDIDIILLSKYVRRRHPLFIPSLEHVTIILVQVL